MSGDELEGGVLKRTPLYKEQVALGAKMAPFAGYEMPIEYAGLISEHHATRNAVGIFDVSHMGEFRLTGAALKPFLQRMLTNDLDRIDEVGAAQYTLMLDEDGHIIDDLIVYNTGGEYLIVANAANRATDFDWLSSHAPDGVEIVDESDRTALVAVQGPRALQVIAELAGADWIAPERFHVSEALLQGTLPALIARTGYTGEDGVEVFVRSSDAPALWRALLSFPEVSPAGLGARDTLRLEVCYSLYGSDMDRTRSPLEAGLGWVCPKTKSGYVGAEVVAAQRETPPAEVLRYLRLERGVPRHGCEVFALDQKLGTVASGSHSPTLGVGIATAYLPREFSKPGTAVELDIRGRRVSAEVVKPPFYVKDSV
ncbi:MAG: glycine cleavage system aminomethyltransferase GcvT [Actinomycetia bacterium]|nr:glycine cleavage system aminomethyltransferase GcvT [Actinomycetes bacterium]